jgi:glycosyltransferase involved in cell wall biosynthesis
MPSRLQRVRLATRNSALLIRRAFGGPPVPSRKPLVSVVVATYNWSGVLHHAVASALEQTYENFELIVVGDACTDDSEAVVRAFGDPRVRWENLAENSGSQAIPNNRGIALARGELIAYLGHDDVWHPYHLATLVSAFDRPDLDLAWTVAAVLGPPGSGIRTPSGRLGSSPGELGAAIPPCTIMHRRALAERTGGWRDWRGVIGPVDIDMLDRAKLAGARVRLVPALTVFKFPAALRPDSYRKRETHEQADCLRRIRTHRGLRLREVLALLGTRLTPRPKPWLAIPGADVKEPGGFTRRARKVRGLD